MAGTADRPIRRVELVVPVVAVPAGLLGIGLAAVLARSGPEPAGWAVLPRVLAVLAGSLVVGMLATRWWEDPRRRDALAVRSWPVVVTGTSVWVVAELAHLLLDAAAVVPGGTGSVDAATLRRFVRDLSPGRTDALVLAAALATGALAVTATRSEAVRGWAGAPALGTAGVALLARPVTGHLSDSTVGAVAVVAHVGAAAVWTGGLAAVALLAGAHRGTWARLLPRFSRTALWCVAVLVVSGTVAAVVRLGSPADLVTTAYGRIVGAKILTVVVLVALGQWARLRWVPAAATHQAGAAASVRHAAVELAVMGLALGLAGALASTG